VKSATVVPSPPSVKVLGHLPSVVVRFLFLPPRGKKGVRMSRPTFSPHVEYQGKEDGLFLPSFLVFFSVGRRISVRRALR